jgi:hypothetical protein
MVKEPIQIGEKREHKMKPGRRRITQQPNKTTELIKDTVATVDALEESSEYLCLYQILKQRDKPKPTRW